LHEHAATVNQHAGDVRSFVVFLEVSKISFSTSSLKSDLAWLQYKRRIMSSTPGGLGISRLDWTMLEG